MSRARTRRRRRVLAAVVGVLAAVAGATWVAFGGAPGREHAPPGSQEAPEWVAAVEGWPSALGVDPEGDTVVVHSAHRVVTALDAATGARRWSRRLDGVGPVPSVVGGGLVVVPADDRVVALDRGDGAPRWEVPAAEVQAVARDGRRASVMVASRTGAVAAHRASDGARRWSRRLDGRIGAPVTLGGGVVAALVEGELASAVVVLDADDGTTRFAHAVGDGSSAPLVAADRVVVGDGAGAIRAWRVDDGRPAWTVAVAAGFTQELTPVESGGEVLLVDRRGTLHAVGLGTGVPHRRAVLGMPVVRGRPVESGGAVTVAGAGGDLVAVDRGRGHVTRRDRSEGFAVAVAAAAERLVVARRWTEPGRVEAWRTDDPARWASGGRR